MDWGLREEREGVEDQVLELTQPVLPVLLGLLEVEQVEAEVVEPEAAAVEAALVIDQVEEEQAVVQVAEAVVRTQLLGQSEPQVAARLVVGGVPVHLGILQELEVPEVLGQQVPQDHRRMEQLISLHYSSGVVGLEGLVVQLVDPTAVAVRAQVPRVVLGVPVEGLSILKRQRFQIAERSEPMV